MLPVTAANQTKNNNWNVGDAASPGVQPEGHDTGVSKNLTVQSENGGDPSQSIHGDWLIVAREKCNKSHQDPVSKNKGNEEIKGNHFQSLLEESEMGKDETL